MGVIYDNDFQSYSLGTNPPYGALENVAIVTPVIANTVPGVFGDAKVVQMPSLKALRHPRAAVDGSDPAYTALTVRMAINLDLGAGTDEQGTLIEYASQFSVGVGGIMAFMSIFSDGSLGFALFGEVFKISDFSLLRGGWHALQFNTLYFPAGGFLACAFEIGVNGISVLAGTQISTTRTIASMPVTYINSITLGGCGGGSYLGRTTIYDSIEPIGGVEHPGSPEARISEGVIELVLSPDKWRVYEA